MTILKLFKNQLLSVLAVHFLQPIQMGMLFEFASLINRESSMWIRTHSKVYADICKKKVWQLWQDVNNWENWHDDIEYCKMSGTFVVGNQFVLKPDSGPEVNIELTEINENVGFTDCTKFFGARMYDKHLLEETPEGLRITNVITVTGPLKYLWVKLVANNVAKSHPQEMDKLASLARSDSN